GAGRRGAGGEADCAGPTRLEELLGRQRWSGGKQAQSGKGAENHLGEPVEVADDEGEGAHVERLPEQLADDVVTRRCPEQARQRHVDHHERGRQLSGTGGRLCSVRNSSGRACPAKKRCCAVDAWGRGWACGLDSRRSQAPRSMPVATTTPMSSRCFMARTA